jgi:ElaB/YqjD/DUF883 family membrane-anchored ribosome-binding protein
MTAVTIIALYQGENMADTTKNTSDTGTTQTTPMTGSAPGSFATKTTGGQSATGARTAREQSPHKDWEGGQSSFTDNLERGAQRGAEVIDKARENIGEAYERASEVYDRASHSVAESWDQAVDYGRKNPGTATLIAFGAGVGIGLLIANGMNTRSRSQRIVPPIMNALSEIATELFH